jgi:capsular polysaccharide biosynthesis protein
MISQPDLRHIRMVERNDASAAPLRIEGLGGIMVTCWKSLSEAADFKSLIPAFTRLPPRPQFSFGTFPASVAERYDQQTDMWEIGVYTSQTAGICSGYLRDDDGSFLVAEDLKIHQGDVEQIYPRLNRIFSNNKPRKLPGVLASIIPPGPDYRHYGHWLVDILPRLVVLEAAGFDLRDVWYAVPKDIPPFGRELLSLYGVYGSRLIPYDDGEVLRPDTLVMPTLVHNGVQCSPMMRNFVISFKRALRRNGFDVRSRETPTRIFLLPCGETSQRLLNRGRITSAAKEAGFAVVQLDTMSIRGQLMLFASAREIIGEYGSAFHATMFSAPDTPVCGLRGSDYHPGFVQSGIGDVFGQPTGWVFGSNCDGVDSDTYTVDEEDFRACLNSVFGETPHFAIFSKAQQDLQLPLPALPARKEGGLGISIADVEARTHTKAMDFISNFESLGVNCEFGFVQRRCGAEPLGLLRFAACPLGSLLDCLKNRFEGFGLVENLEPFFANGRLREHMIRDRAFSVHYHTWKREGKVDEALLLSEFAARIDFLKRKLIKSLECGEKLFVWKSVLNVEDKDVISLHDALCAYASNTLLWVVVADSAHPPGKVERLRPGLLKGYIDRSAPIENVPDISFNVWLEICVNAYLGVSQDKLH